MLAHARGLGTWVQDGTVACTGVQDGMDPGTEGYSPTVPLDIFVAFHCKHMVTNRYYSFGFPPFTLDN